MIFGNWYSDYGRHTRSDRKYVKGTVEPAWNGLKLRRGGKCGEPNELPQHLDIKMTDQEIDELIAGLVKIRKAKKKEKI